MARGVAAQSIRRQLLALFALLLGCGVAVISIDEFAQYQARQSLEQLQSRPLERMRALKAVSEGYSRGIVDTTFKVRNYLVGWDDGVRAVDQAQAAIDREWILLEAMPHDGDQRAVFAQADRARARADAAVKAPRAILVRRDIVALGRFADRDLYPAVDPVLGDVRQLGDMAMVEAQALVRADVRRGWNTSALRIGLALLAFLVAAFVVMVAFGGWATASRDAGTPEPVRVVEVQEGDTLYDIAGRVSQPGQVREMVHHIQQLNSLSGGSLQVGQKLAIPAK